MTEKPKINDLKEYDKKFVVEDNTLYEMWEDNISKSEVIWDMENIADLLNSLYDENEQLRKKNEEYKISWSNSMDIARLNQETTRELHRENEQLRKKTEMDKNDFFISEAKRMRLLAFIEDNGLRKEYSEWERRIYDE